MMEPSKGRWPGTFIVQHTPNCVDGLCAPDCPATALGPLAERFNQVQDDWVYCPKPSGEERHGGTEKLTPPPGAVKPNIRWPQEWQASAEAHTEGGFNFHGSVKPLALMEHFVKLVTPTGGYVLDPFVGSGTTIIAAALNGFGGVGIDRDPDYIELARARFDWHIQQTRTTAGDTSLVCGDSMKELGKYPPCQFDSMVTDPPAGIALAGLEWDRNKGGRDEWTKWLGGILKEANRTLKPGAYGVVWAFGKTLHWTMDAAEQGGLTIRAVIAVANGTGFPKGRDPTNEDSSPEFEGKWAGWNTTLRPLADYWVLVQKPISEPTVAANLKKWGVGALNINATRTKVLGPEDGYDGSASLGEW